jgi:hypothetical protein
MPEQVKYGARPTQVSKTASGCPGCHQPKKPTTPPPRPAEKDKKP